MPDKNYRVTAKGGLNIRLGPGVNHKDVGNLAYGELVRSSELEGPLPDGWLPIVLFVSMEHVEGVGKSRKKAGVQRTKSFLPPSGRCEPRAGAWSLSKMKKAASCTFTLTRQATPPSAWGT
ncbi:MAG: hypothetical protein PHU44_13635 [Syntrophales bacterium]|nr:hypothetical protein [Syntrophales bacterium]